MSSSSIIFLSLLIDYCRAPKSPPLAARQRNSSSKADSPATDEIASTGDAVKSTLAEQSQSVMQEEEENVNARSNGRSMSIELEAGYGPSKLTLGYFVHPKHKTIGSPSKVPFLLPKHTTTSSPSKIPFPTSSQSAQSQEVEVMDVDSDGASTVSDYSFQQSSIQSAPSTAATSPQRSPTASLAQFRNRDPALIGLSPPRRAKVSSSARTHRRSVSAGPAEQAKQRRRVIKGSRGERLLLHIPQ